MKIQRPTKDLLSKIQRFKKRNGNNSIYFNLVIEEIRVRMYSYELARRCVRPFRKKPSPEKWIFVVGCYNSGTTLLQKILGAHPEISGLPREGVRFTSVLSNLETNNLHMMWDKNYKSISIPKIPKNDAYRKIVADWSIFLDSDKSICMEKSVSNTARIQWLSESFPNAYFIGICRNGYCVAEGLRRRAIPTKTYQEEQGSKFYTLDSVAEQWNKANEEMLSGFSQIDQTKYRLVAFEDFIASPVTELEKVFRLCELDDSNLSIDSDILTLGRQSFRISNPNKSSLERLTENDRKELEPLILKMSLELGYDVCAS